MQINLNFSSSSGWDSGHTMFKRSDAIVSSVYIWWSVVDTVKQMLDEIKALGLYFYTVRKVLETKKETENILFFYFKTKLNTGQENSLYKHEY